MSTCSVVKFGVVNVNKAHHEDAQQSNPSVCNTLNPRWKSYCFYKCLKQCFTCNASFFLFLAIVQMLKLKIDLTEFTAKNNIVQCFKNVRRISLR